MTVWLLLIVFLVVAIGLLVWILRALVRESVSPWVVWGVGIVGALLIVGGSFAIGQGSLTGAATYRVATAPDAAPDLKSRVYSAPPNDVYRDAVLVAGAQQNLGQPWRVVAQRTTPVSGGVFQAEIPWGLWKNTLDAIVQPAEAGVQVDVTVRAPVFLGWLGVPQREAAMFLEALDATVVHQ
ncbi:MAG: hypothetical protein U0822_01340 [Anaerolineae bacterium]